MEWGSRATDESRDAGRRARRRTGRGLAAAVIAVGALAFASPALAATTRSASRASSSGGPDVSSISGSVDPAIVDVNTTLAQGAAAGTGMVISSSGEVLTNNHVIDGATSVSVTAASGKTYDAKVVGYDATDDVAVLLLQGARSSRRSPRAAPSPPSAILSWRSETPSVAAARPPPQRGPSPR